MWKDGKFVLPDDIKADPEKVSQYYDTNYGERYKDYDTPKTRAGEADEWGKLGKREDIETERQTLSRMTDALRQGKVIVTDAQGRIFAKDPSELTPAERRQAAADPVNQGGGASDDWLPDNFDELTPRQQAAAQRKAFQQMLAQTVTEKEKQYGTAIEGITSQTNREVNTVLQIQAALQEHPTLKLKEVLTKMAEYATKQHPNPLQAALDEFTRPAEIEALAQKRAAELIAEGKLKDEKAKSEKVLSNGSPLAQMMRNRKPQAGKVTNDQISDMLRDKGLLN